MIRDARLEREFRPFPSYGDRKSWEEISGELKEIFCTAAREKKGWEWPSLPAIRYMDYYRDGNRSRFQALYHERRRTLFNLLAAECIEGRGEYLDDIINGVWLICEESSWVVPAHVNWTGRRGPVRELPDIEDNDYIDLYNAETGSLLSWVYYFLAEPLAALSPLVKRRIEIEVERRILKPYLAHDDFPWMGLNHDKPVNNWNPWINSNVLTAYLVFAPVFPAAPQGVSKAIRSINRFFGFYAEDGGCDEGPGYFNAAGASFLDFVEELGAVSDVSYLYRDQKLKNMAAYIYKVYIGKDHYVNYADAAPSLFPAVSLLERVAKKTGDTDLLGFTAQLRKNQIPPGVSKGHAVMLYRRFADILSPRDREDRPFTAPALSWFPGIQVLTAREEGDSSPLFFSAKGGHNDESHNHNDIGNFLLYCGGNPVLIDAGAETYTKKTFSPKRYEIWTMQSCFHNTPTINGFDQCSGMEYRAAKVSLCPDEPSEGGKPIRFLLDIAGAYPSQAQVESYRREFTFQPGSGLLVSDTFTLKEWKAPLTLNFLCYDKPVFSGGAVVLSAAVSLVCDFEFEALVEEIPLTDEKIRGDWRKESLYRMRLVLKHQQLSAKLAMRFRKN
jgi:hypothetical protein